MRAFSLIFLVFIPVQTAFGSFFWERRPQSLNNCINEAFERIRRTPMIDSWSFFGEASYWLCDISDTKIVSTLIQEAPESQKDFYFLDIGAGNFSWSIGLAEFLNKENLREEATYHIIGINGETHFERNSAFKEGIVKDGNCIRYQFGSFKIEELIEELRKKDLNLLDSIDLIVSRWTFKHLADPVGTLLQACNLLRPKGIFLCDGIFTIFTEISPDPLPNPNVSSTESVRHFRKYQTLILHLLNNVTFWEQNQNGYTASFFLKRESETPVQLPQEIIYGESVPNYFPKGLSASLTLTQLVCVDDLRREQIRKLITEDLLDSSSLPAGEEIFVMGTGRESLEWCKSRSLFDPRFASKKCIPSIQFLD